MPATDFGRGARLRLFFGSSLMVISLMILLEVAGPKIAPAS